MPPGFSASDFYYILPELVLTGGALVVLLLSVVTPRRDGLLLGVSLATVAATLLGVASFAGLDETVSRGAARHRRASPRSSRSWCSCRRR